MAARSPVVSTSVPTNPPARAAQTLIVWPRRDRPGGVDQRQVGQALREVAEEGAGGGVDLLRVEADVVGEADELVHQRRGIVGAGRMRASASASQNEQVRNAPSPPARPSSPL